MRLCLLFVYVLLFVCCRSSNLHSYFGPVHHPLSYTSESDRDWLVCGGSSGGSAVAVATGMCDL